MVATSGPTPTEFPRTQAHGIIAGDCFSAETAWLRTLDVLVVSELGRRRIHLQRVQRAARLDPGHLSRRGTSRPTSTLGRAPSGSSFETGTRKFSRSFDEVVRSAGARLIVTPVQAPDADAHAERVIETIRVE